MEDGHPMLHFGVAIRAQEHALLSLLSHRRDGSRQAPIAEAKSLVRRIEMVEVKGGDAA